MKNILKTFLFMCATALVFAACKKFDSLPFYPNGTAPVLTSDVTAISSAPADSANSAITLSWTNPNYSTDSSKQKFVIQIDSAGKNFTNAYSKTVTGTLSASFTASELNDIASDFLFKPGATYSLDMRVLSSYGNNNEQYPSNVVSVTITPYIVPITFAVSSTAPLVLDISDASNTALSFNWTPSKFGNAKVYYALQADTSSDFLTPQLIKYGTNVTTADITVGDLNTLAINAGIEAGSSGDLNMRIAAYLDADYTTAAIVSNTTTVNITTYLPFIYNYVPGAYQGWDPPTAPSIAATVPDLNAFEGYVNVPASSSSFEFKITSANDWNHTNYGDGGNGTLSTANNAGNLMWPNGAGYYLLKTNMSNLTWSATITNWGIIGSATPNGWNSSTAMSYDATNKVWTINSIALTVGEAKFRANDAWDINFGGDLNNLSYNGSNIQITEAGNYNVTLDLSHPRKYMATFTKL